MGIDPLEEGYTPLTEPEEHGVGIAGSWALRWPDPLPACDELMPDDYVMFFWYVIDGEYWTVRWQVLGETVFSHVLKESVARIGQ